MEEFVKGDVVVVPFPFSDLSRSKRRPAFIAANLRGDDLILCQITSEARIDEYSVFVENSDFKNGGLNLASVVRPNRIFTADKSIILYKAGSLKQFKISEVENVIVDIFRE
jgi:mRNA interferase MazF